MSTTAAGATPGTGATPDHRYPTGPGWATYRLPFAGTNGLITAREAGVSFDGEPGDGAAPPTGQSPADSPATDPRTPPATGDPDALGDAGKRALDAMKAERDAAKREAADVKRRLDELEGANATETEKAIKAAREDSAKAVRAEFEAKIRRSEARSALRVAGVTNEKDLELAANAPEFASLAVGDDGAVTDLAAAVEQFRKDHPSLFGQAPRPAAGGNVTRGPSNPAPGTAPKTLAEAVAASLAS